jgi:hypothetical protein
MSEIIDLEMSDEEYLQLIAQGRDPVMEKLYERQLIKLCTSLEQTDEVLSKLRRFRETAVEESVSIKACERFQNYLTRQPRRRS